MTSEKFTLELPGIAKRAPRKGRRAGFLLLVLLLACAGIFVARHFSAIHTPSALLESETLALSPGFTGRVVEILVRKTQRVSAGQLLMRLEPDTRGADAAEAEAQVAAVRGLLSALPDMRAVAERAANAQIAEQETVQLIAQARAAEDAAVRDVQHKAEAHARAQLELRRLDMLSARYAVPRVQYEKAGNEESLARRALEKARAAREESSRVRAAVEGELRSMQTELAELRRTGARRQSTDARLPEAAAGAGARTDPHELVAPVESVVADLFTQEGARVLPEQQLVTLLPEGSALSVTAWIPQSESRSVQPGRGCRIFISDLPGRSFAGRVEQLLPASGAPPRFPLSGPEAEQHVPVLIRFAENDAPAELKSGMRVAARIYRFDLPWEALLRRIGL